MNFTLCQYFLYHDPGVFMSLCGIELQLEVTFRSRLGKRTNMLGELGYG